VLDLAVGLGVVDEDHERVLILLVQLLGNIWVYFPVELVSVDLHGVGHPVEVVRSVHLLVLVLDEAPEGPQHLLDRGVDLLAAPIFLACGVGHL